MYSRILVVGCGGAGKSTLSRRMGELFGIPVVHLDKLWWKEGWATETEEEFDRILSRELRKPAWIMDGNYKRTFAERLRYADFCIVLDVEASVCIGNVYKRAREYAGKSRPDMAPGCAEYVSEEFERWIYSYKTETLPVMMRILQESKVPFRVFGSCEEALQKLTEIFQSEDN